MGESRSELLAWLNELLDLKYNKVEQCGNGAAYCQILDSIYRNMPMSKIKFNAKLEYESLQNFKILQTAFTNRGIDKVVPVDRLVKAKMQDNIEFLQWMKKFWDSHYPGGSYDAPSRRGERNVPAANPPRPNVAKKIAATTTATVASPARSRRTTTEDPVQPVSKPGGLAGSSEKSKEKENIPAAVDSTQIIKLTNELTKLHVALDQIEKERDFYFERLRKVEELVMERSDEIGGDDPFIKQLQDVMYSPEEGFETPAQENSDAIDTF